MFEKRILSYYEKEIIYKILGCDDSNHLKNNSIYNLFQVKTNMDTFLNLYEKDITIEDVKNFALTKAQIGILVKSMDTICGSDSVFRNNQFIYGVLYTAKLIDNNQISSGVPIFHSKLIVMDIIKYRNQLIEEFNQVFMTNNYVYDKSHIELFVNNIKTFGYLAIKIKQLYQLKNFLICNIRYLKKVNLKKFTGVTSYSDLLKQRNEHMTHLSDIDPNDDNDYFGGRFDKRHKEYDKDINLDDYSSSSYKEYDEWSF